LLAGAINNQVGNSKNLNTVCDECEDIAQRFTALSKDQAKMTLMKKFLSNLCPKTKYSEECQIIVDKIDVIVPKFLSYMKNPQPVCNQFNMCSGSQNTDGVRRLVLSFIKHYLNKMDGSKDSTCNDCQYAAHEILSVVSEPKTQAHIKDLISNKFCALLGQYQDECNNMNNNFMPALFTELQAMFEDNQQFCADLKLCSKNEVEVHRLTANEMKNKLMGPKYVQNLLKSLQALKTPEPHVLAVSCSECQILADIVLDTLETTNGTSMISGVLKVIMGTKLPPQWGSDDFVDTYGTTIVYMTLQQLDSESLCEMMQMCTDDSSSDIAKHSKSALLPLKCSNCETMSSFMLTEMQKPKAKTEIVYGLTNLFCKDAPHVLHNTCENFFDGLLPNAYDKFMHALNNQPCKTINAC